MLAFLLQIGASSQLKTVEADEKAGSDPAIYFDLLVSFQLTSVYFFYLTYQTRSLDLDDQLFYHRCRVGT